MADTKKQDTNQENMELQEHKLTASERFASEIARQFEAEAGSPVHFTPYERTLAQHLFLKVDACLKEFETKRNDNSKPAYIWQNVNMLKLALDAVHRIHLGLDALINAHLYPVPYLNGRTNKYDIDLRVGYRGKDYYRRNSAVEPPLDIRYELVYSNDRFAPIKKDFKNEVEGYEFEITSPFDRGNVVGGFAYISYDDPKKNLLVLVGEKDFKKSESAAKSKDFWSKYPVEMRYKTLVHRATENLPVDPRKVNTAAYAYVESQDGDAEEQARRTINQSANGAPIIVYEDDFRVESEFVENDTPVQAEQPPVSAVPDDEPGF